MSSRTTIGIRLKPSEVGCATEVRIGNMRILRDIDFTFDRAHNVDIDRTVHGMTQRGTGRLISVSVECATLAFRDKGN